MQDQPHQSPYNALWSRPGLTLAGRGSFRTFDPGVGPGRYATALDQLRATEAEIAFASFTFDPFEPGSLIVVPETVDDRLEVDPVVYGGTIEDDDSERWPKMVGEALEEIQRGRVEKVVLSRRVRALLDSPADPFAVAARLTVTQPGANIYVLGTMVGASPELLLQIADGKVRSTPLAGSATADRPDLDTEKNINEHLLAAESVDAAFVAAGVGFERSQPEIIDVGLLRHIGTRFEGDAPEGLEFSDVLPHLHPTAAVAGTPTEVAIALIREMEDTPRRGYSGPVGWFDRHGEGEFAVALRCGIIEGRTALLHSGAGIVAGSRPDDELEETGWKLTPMLEALGISAR